MSPHPLIGKPAPSFSLPDSNGDTFTFTPGENGLPSTLFFYPKAGSFGCTKEACSFRDAVATKDTFGQDKVKIIGISSDSVAEQAEFVKKNKLTYPVLSDAKHETAKLYSVGKGLFGLVPTARVTFFIDGKGVVRDAVDSTINYAAHTKFVAGWLDKLAKENQKELDTAASVPVPEPSSEPAPNAETAAK